MEKKEYSKGCVSLKEQEPKATGVARKGQDHRE